MRDYDTSSFSFIPLTPDERRAKKRLKLDKLKEEREAEFKHLDIDLDADLPKEKK